MTNYEHIKSLSVLDMAVFLSGNVIGNAEYKFCRDCREKHKASCLIKGYCEYDSTHILKWWLEQPATNE